MFNSNKTKRVWKLTDAKKRTENNTRWGFYKTNRIKSKTLKEYGNQIHLCTESCLHCYENPYMAVLMNTIHADLRNPILWKATAKGLFVNEGQLKMGCTVLTTIKRIPLPTLTSEQRINICIRMFRDVMASSSKFAMSITTSRDSAFIKWLDEFDASGKALKDYKAEATLAYGESNKFSCEHDCILSAIASIDDNMQVDYQVACFLQTMNRIFTQHKETLDILKYVKEVLGDSFIDYNKE